MFQTWDKAMRYLFNISNWIWIPSSSTSLSLFLLQGMTQIPCPKFFKKISMVLHLPDPNSRPSTHNQRLTTTQGFLTIPRSMVSEKNLNLSNTNGSS